MRLTASPSSRCRSGTYGAHHHETAEGMRRQLGVGARELRRADQTEIIGALERRRGDALHRLHQPVIVGPSASSACRRLARFAATVERDQDGKSRAFDVWRDEGRSRPGCRSSPRETSSRPARARSTPSSTPCIVVDAGAINVAAAGLCPSVCARVQSMAAAAASPRATRRPKRGESLKMRSQSSVGWGSWPVAFCTRSVNAGSLLICARNASRMALRCCNGNAPRCAVA